MIVDDVITAGTAIGEVMRLFTAYPQASVSAVLIGLDRQERGQGSLSAAQEVSQRFDIPVLRVLGLPELIVFLQQQPEQEQTLAAILRYREQYACS